MPIKRFDSLTEYIQANQGYTSSHWESAYYTLNSKKLGREGIEQLALQGMPELLPMAENLMESLEIPDLAASIFANVRSEFGPRLAMGEWLAGSPTAFRRRKKVVTESAPINIIVDLFGSAAISNEDLLKRGAAILALVGILSRFRAVDLWIGICSLDRNERPVATAFRVDTRPINLSQCSFVLGHPAFMRVLCFGSLVTDLNTNRVIPMPYLSGRSQKHQELFEITENDLFIEGVNSVNTPTISDPIAWINQQLARFSGSAESENGE